jgi:putative tricarboxylic transport membrane protein
MKHRNRWSAAGLAVLALAYLLAGRQYPLDTLATPGPGIMPLLAALGLLATAIWLLVVAGSVVAGSARPAQTEGGLSETPVAPTRLVEPSANSRTRWTALALCAALVLYTALLPRVGFAVSSFALVVVAARLMGAEGWLRPVALALGVAGVAHLLFARWLGVPLP